LELLKFGVIWNDLKLPTSLKDGLKKRLDLKITNENRKVIRVIRNCDLFFFRRYHRFPKLWRCIEEAFNDDSQTSVVKYDL